jgi:hypothetical protein
VTFYSELKLWPYPIAKFRVEISASVVGHLVGGELEMQEWTCVRFLYRGWGLGVTYIVCRCRCFNPPSLCEGTLWQHPCLPVDGLSERQCDVLSLRPPERCRLRLKCDGTRAQTRFHLSAKRTSPFKSTRPSVRSTTGSQGVRIRGSNAGYFMFWGSVKSTGYPLHSPVSPSLSLPCVTVCHHNSTGLYCVSSTDLMGRKQRRKCSAPCFLVLYF